MRICVCVLPYAASSFQSVTASHGGVETCFFVIKRFRCAFGSLLWKQISLFTRGVKRGQVVSCIHPSLSSRCVELIVICLLKTQVINIRFSPVYKY